MGIYQGKYHSLPIFSYFSHETISLFQIAVLQAYWPINQFDICGPLRSYVRRHIKGPIQTSKMRPETGNESFVVIFFSLFPVEWAPCDACLLGCLT